MCFWYTVGSGKNQWIMLWILSQAGFLTAFHTRKMRNICYLRPDSSIESCWALFQLVLTDNLTQSRHWRQEPGLMRINLWTCLCKMWRAQSTTVGGTGAGGLGLDEKSGWIQVCEWTDKQRFSIVARLAFSSDRSYPESISKTTSFLCRVHLVKVFLHSNRKEMGTVFNGQENFFLIGY